MADEDKDLEEAADEPKDLDEEALDEDLEGDDDEIDEDFVADEIDEVLEDDEEEVEAPVVVEEAEAEDDDDDEVEDPNDVEADLDTILKDRLVAVEDEEDEEEEEPADPEDKTNGARVRPKAPGEFVCQSCFLVKHPSQLADAKRHLCTDCV